VIKTDISSVFTLDVLRCPLYKLSKYDRERITLLKKLYSKIDESFLDNVVEPRLIVIIAES
jgi:hypothetical protein